MSGIPTPGPSSNQEVEVDQQYYKEAIKSITKIMEQLNSEDSKEKERALMKLIACADQTEDKAKDQVEDISENLETMYIRQRQRALSPDRARRKQK